MSKTVKLYVPIIQFTAKNSCSNGISLIPKLESENFRYQKVATTWKNATFLWPGNENKWKWKWILQLTMLRTHKKQTKYTHTFTNKMCISFSIVNVILPHETIFNELYRFCRVFFRLLLFLFVIEMGRRMGKQVEKDEKNTTKNQIKRQWRELETIKKVNAILNSSNIHNNNELINHYLHCCVCFGTGIGTGTSTNNTHRLFNHSTVLSRYCRGTLKTNKILTTHTKPTIIPIYNGWQYTTNM